MSDEPHPISIWFFIGSLLAVYGILILGAGIHGWLVPESVEGVVLSRWHAGVWWGLLLLAAGGLYSWRFRPGRAGGPAGEPAPPADERAGAGD